MSEKVLFIGGTGNISLPCVAEAVSAGYDVTVFNRSVTGADLPPGVTSIAGDMKDPFAYDELGKGGFDLVVLGPTLSRNDRHHLPYMVKKAHAGTKVLVMHAGTHHHEVDAAIDPNISMNRILEKIAAVIQPAGR